MSIPGHDTKGLPIFSDADVASQPDPVWLVDELLKEQSLGAMFGPSGCGKTFVALDLAFSVATGKAFHGHEVQKGRVVYVYAEGSATIKLRVFALKKERGIPFDRECGVYFVPLAVDLVDSPDGYNELIKAIERKGIADVALVVVDTLAACFGTGNENSTQDMNAFTNRCSKLRHHLGAAILVIHHTGWKNEKRERGSKSLRNNSDAILGCSKSNDLVELSSAKQRDGVPFDPIQFKLVEIALDNGTSSCVVRPSDALLSSLRDTDLVLLDCLAELGPGGATHGEWKRAALIGDSTFGRKRNDLLEAGFVNKPPTGDSKGFRYTITVLGRTQFGSQRSQNGVKLSSETQADHALTVPQQSQADIAEVCDKHHRSIIVPNSPTVPSNGTGPHGGASRAPRGTDRDWTEAEDDAEVFACMDCLRALLAGYDSCPTCSAEVARV